jgi:hypothetical protein
MRKFLQETLKTAILYVVIFFKEEQMYHFTSPIYLSQIMRDGMIEVTDSCLEFDIKKPAPQVVWLTTNPDPEKQQWIGQSLTFGSKQWGSKNEIRITIDRNKLQDAQLKHWPEWSAEHGIEQWWYDSLANVGGDPEDWWCYVEARIKWTKWLEIVQTTNGEAIWVPDGKHPRDSTGYLRALPTTGS